MPCSQEDGREAISMTSLCISLSDSLLGSALLGPSSEHLSSKFAHLPVLWSGASACPSPTSISINLLLLASLKRLLGILPSALCVCLRPSPCRSLSLFPDGYFFPAFSLCLYFSPFLCICMFLCLLKTCLLFCANVCLPPRPLNSISSVSLLALFL